MRKPLNAGWTVTPMAGYEVPDNVAAAGAIPATVPGCVHTDLRRHRELVTGADLVLTMTAEQKTLLGAVADGARPPVFTLAEFAGGGGDIRDPMGHDEDRYRATRDEIRRYLERSIDRLLGMLG